MATLQSSKVTGYYGSDGKWVTLGSKYPHYIRLEYSLTPIAASNKTKVKWKCLSENTGNTTGAYVKTAPVKVIINGTTVLNLTSRFNMTSNMSLGSGELEVAHDNNGRKSITISLSAAIGSGSVNSTYSGTITLPSLPIYDLSISAGTGSSITVYRTSSGGIGATGNLTAGTNKLYYGDQLKISFTPNTNYAISTHTVNGSNFTSGNTHDVSGDVSVISTAQVLSSSISASDADIEAVSTIKITRYNNSYYHSIKYQYGSLSGYINRDGTTSSDEVKFTDDTINFTLPSSFYGETPRSPTGSCKLTCYTYEKENSSQTLGSATECTFTATVSRAKSSPIISKYSITSDNTTYLTGDSTILVRHLSDVNVSVEAEPKNSAFISKITINNDVFNNVDTAAITYEKVTDNKFVITAVDTRGYSVETTPPVTIIPYLPLTLNAVINRKPPSGDGSTSEIVATFNGNCFNGSFGVRDNNIVIDFCYKERSSESATYSDWIPLSIDNYIISTDRYYTTSEVSLGEEYNYQKIYDFKIRITDSTGVENAVIQDIQTLPAIPVFDWGEKDFNFNVPVSYATQPLFYTTGDTVSVDYARACFAGYLTENATQIYFTIPLNRPALANGVTIDGMVTPRGINGYVTAATWSDEAAHIDLKGMDNNYSVETQLNDIGITVIITFVNKITSTPNNTPIILTPRNLTTITFT